MRCHPLRIRRIQRTRRNQFIPRPVILTPRTSILIIRTRIRRLRFTTLAVDMVTVAMEGIAGDITGGRLLIGVGIAGDIHTGPHATVTGDITGVDGTIAGIGTTVTAAGDFTAMATAVMSAVSEPGAGVSG